MWTKRKKLKEKEFIQIKKLLDLKIRQVKIADLFNRSSSTVSTISKFDNLEEYKKFNNNRITKSLGKNIGTRSKTGNILQQIELIREALTNIEGQI